MFGGRVFVGQNKSVALKALCLVFLGGSASALFAASTLPSCTAGTLASYITSTSDPGGGCAIGVLDYFNFSYHSSPTNPGPLSSDLEVSVSGAGFSFSRADGTPVTALPGQTVQFEIDYQIVIDPAPIIGGGDMSLDPPTGNVVVTEYFCNDVAYRFTAACLGNVIQPDVLTVGTPVTGFPLTASITFANPARVSQNVGISFTLIGGANGASFDGLSATSQVLSLSPEPASAACLLFGLLALGGGYKLRKQRTR